MGFTLITEGKEIQACQAKLECELKKRGEQFTCYYAARGFPEGTTSEAWYFPAYDIYWRPKGPYSKHKRHLNFFGQGKPKRRFKDAFQLNIPHDGVDRKIKGSFLKSGAALCVLHRGPLGGGRKDGSHNLCNYFRDLVSSFDDDGIAREGVMIPFLDKSGQLEPDFLPTIKRIVDDLAERLGRAE
jgi:hypothetical protein